MTRLIDTSYAAYYGDYMSSAEWKVKRAQRIVIDGGRCTKCDSSDELQVHHLDYDSLGNEEMDDLVTLCKTCHLEVHNRSRVVKDTAQRGMLSETHAWADSVRTRAARLSKELDGFLWEFRWCEPDPRREQVRELLAAIMESFEVEYAHDVANISRGLERAA